MRVGVNISTSVHLYIYGISVYLRIPKCRQCQCLNLTFSEFIFIPSPPQVTAIDWQQIDAIAQSI